MTLNVCVRERKNKTQQQICTAIYMATWLHCVVTGPDLPPPLFQAYGSGCDVVILASDFECVQIIPGAQNGNIQVGCVECSHQLGRVSARSDTLPRAALFSPRSQEDAVGYSGA